MLTDFFEPVIDLASRKLLEACVSVENFIFCHASNPERWEDSWQFDPGTIIVCDPDLGCIGSPAKRLFQISDELVKVQFGRSGRVEREIKRYDCTLMPANPWIELLTTTKIAHFNY